MKPRLTRAQASAERSVVDVTENERTGDRKRKIKDPDLTEGHTKGTYRMSSCANLPYLIMGKQVAPARVLPRTRKSPERKIVLPRHVREMDSSMSILLDVRSDISHSKIKDYDTALETIIGIQSSAICKNFLSYRPEARKFIPITEHQEEIAKRKLESEKIIAKLKKKVTQLKIKVDKIAKENLELEKKSIDYAADRDYWKGRVVELERQPIKVPDSQSDALDCPMLELKVALLRKGDEFKTLSSQVSNLKELICAEKMGATLAVNRLTQLGQLIRASAEIVSGKDSGPNSNCQQMVANGTMAEDNNPEEVLEIRMSQLQGLGPPTNSESACSRNEGLMPNNKEMDVDDDIASSTRASGIHLPVTWSSISLDFQETVKSKLRLQDLNAEKIVEKLEGPILVELMNGRMPPEKDLFESIIECQFSKYRATSGEAGFSSIELVDVHEKLALDNIFPPSSQNLAIANSLNFVWKEEILKLGIVEVNYSEGDIKFVEDGFADYFVARWLTKLLFTQGGWNKEISIFFIKHALALDINVEDLSDDENDDERDNSDQVLKCYTFLEERLCSLLNSIVDEQKEDIVAHLIDFTEVCDESDITAIGRACVYDGFSHLFKLILTVGTFNGSGVSHLLFANSVIFAVASKPSLEFFKMGKSSFKSDCWMNVDLKVKAIKKAAQRGDLPMVEFLLNEMGMSETVKEPNEKLADLIHHCIEFSYHVGDEELTEKKRILQFLNSVNPYLKNLSREGNPEKGERPPLLGYMVHSSLLTALVELGADVHAVDHNSDTVLHCNAQDGEVFESLLNIIPDKDLKELVHAKGFHGDTPLMRVVRWNCWSNPILEKLLAAEADVNVVDIEGYSVIAVAIREGKDASLVNLLMDLGACTAWRGKKHETLLHLAVCVRGLSTEFVSVLLKNKIDPNCEDADGCTPLDYLFDNEQMSSHYNSTLTETAILLQSAGGKLKVKLRIDDAGQTILHRQVGTRTCCEIKLLVELGLNVSEADNHGNTPLHVVAGHWQQDQIEKMEFLLNNNANPDAMNSYGETPLHIGLKNRSLSLENYKLLKSRTNVPSTEAFIVLQLEYVISECTWYSTADLQDLLVSLQLDQKHYFQYKTKDGDSLLHVATICGNEAAVKLLVLEGLDINVRNPRLQTPLHVAASFDEKDKTIGMAKCLIENGANPDLKDAEDYTFLHQFILASKNTNPKKFNNLVKYLLWRNSLCLFNMHGGPNGSTPLQEAVKLLRLTTETITSLTSHGVDIKVLDKHGDSVLSYAVRGRKDEKFLTNLVEMGLDWKHLNFKGQNLLHFATQARNWKAVELLMENGVVWREMDLKRARKFGWKQSQ